ncbi:MAG: molecular chaperone HtpG [Bacteroidales bacterium]|nr:molecular chaperone HtpG [Bacteroidales bacterium]
MQTGKINVTTENIFPIIKKFLYSDHEIFLRELVSNAIDASQKLKTLQSVGEFKGKIKDQTIQVKLDKKKKTLTISDSGIGMTEEEIQKYINQIAFSSAEDFLDKYKDKANAIIGHFGLGFYSAFMVSKKVDIITKSYKPNSKAVKWSCDGSPEFTLEQVEKENVGTDIVLHIDKDSKEFLEEPRINELLRKYSRYLPIPIAFGKEKEWKDGKEIETGKDNIINITTPAWIKKPSELKDEDYLEFYKDLYPMQEDPLFNIHLNVDYPFNLTGILYFPKLKNQVEVQKNKINLFSNQVYVTDSVEGIVPEFLTLLHGVIDSPDIPLNVSRSYLQSDSNVKKISSHINKKVSDRLNELFKKDRKEFEAKWDDLNIFISYGMLSDEKFYERAQKYALLKNTEGDYFTFEEYKKLIQDNQTDKNKSLIYLYATNKDEQYSFVESARAKGYDVLLMDGHLDTHLVSHLEQKFENSRFVRVDSDVIDKLILKEDAPETKLSADEQLLLKNVLIGPLPGKENFDVDFADMNENDVPLVITQSEFTRRMKEMSALGGGMSFYGNMPDRFSLVVNSNNPLVIRVLNDASKAHKKELKGFSEKLSSLEDHKQELQKAQEGKKEEEVKQEEKDKLSKLETKILELEGKRTGLLEEYGKENSLISQLTDLALLSNNMLKGENLTKFVKRSIELI